MRRFSTCTSSFDWYGIFVSLVRPSTRPAISGAEPALDFFERNGRVLDDVVQQARRDRRRVHLELGEDGGDRERMGDEGLAAGAGLPAVGGFRKRVHLLEPCGVEGGVVRLDLLDEVGEFCGHGVRVFIIR